MALILLSIVFMRLFVRVVPNDPAVEASKPAHVIAVSDRMTIPVAGVNAKDSKDNFDDERNGGASRHDAIDIIAPRGRQVIAATDGFVEKLFWSRAGGRTLYQRTNDRRLILYYAHLESYAPDLVEGRLLHRGQVIGTVGSTGNADPTGPHLHFAIYRAREDEPWYGGRAINPYPILTGR